MFFALLFSLTAYTYNFHDWLNLPTMDRVVSITTDNFDVYVAVSHGVYVIEKGDRRLKRTITESDGIRGEIAAIGFDPEVGSLWVLSSGHVLSVDPFSDVTLSFDLPREDISSLGVGMAYLYFPNGQGYYRMDKRTGQLDTIGPGSRKVAWYGVRAPHQPEDYTFLTPFLYRDAQLNEYPISSVFPDGRRLYVGTSGYGLYLYSLSTRQPLAYWRFGPAGGNVDRIFGVDGALWFSNEDELTRYDSQRDTWSYYPTPFQAWFPDRALLLRPKLLDLRRHESILAVAGDSTGYFVGTDRNLYAYRPKTNGLIRQFKPTTRVYGLLTTRETVFVATDGGLVSYDRRHRVLALINDSTRQSHFGVFGIAATDRHRYYGVYGGFETEDSTGGWQVLTPPGYLLSDHPTVLAGAGNKLFAGTEQGVLVYNERDRSYTTLSTENGLLSNRVRSLYADAHYLWVATELGISRFDYRALFP